jgi:hypothetical protein
VSGDPPDWFVWPLFELQKSVYQNTAIKGSFRLVVSAEMALRLGIPPGENMLIAGPAGYVDIRGEEKP